MPKIAYIVSKESDYLQDLLLDGLAKLLPVGELLVLPVEMRYALHRKPYPRHLCKLPKGHLIFSLTTRLKSYEPDFVVLASCKADVVRRYAVYRKHISAQVPVVFVDGGDWEAIGGDLAREGQPDLMAQLKIEPQVVFKREYGLNTTYPDHVFPLSFCFHYGYLPQRNIPKKYEVSFWAVESHPKRSQALDLLSGKWDCDANGTVRNQNFSKYKRKGRFYLEELAATKVAINIQGAGFDTLRYWEVPALGSVMVSEEPTILIPNNFIDGEHVRFCKPDLSNLLEITQELLDDSAQRERLGSAAAKHAQEFHSTSARAKWFLERLGGE